MPVMSPQTLDTEPVYTEEELQRFEAELRDKEEELKRRAETLRQEQELLKERGKALEAQRREYQQVTVQAAASLKASYERNNKTGVGHKLIYISFYISGSIRNVSETERAAGSRRAASRRS